MSQFAVPVQFHTRRALSAGAGAGAKATTNVARFAVVQDFSATPTFRVPGIPRDALIARVRVTVASLAQVFETTFLELDWAVTSLSPGLIDNGLVPAVDFVGGSLVTFAGTALALLGAGVIVADVEVTWLVTRGQIAETARGPVYNADLYSPACALAFADTADGDDPVTGNLAPMFTKLEQQVARSGNGRVQLLPPPTTQSSALVVNGCALAFPAASGSIILTSADIGTGFGQVPPDRALWQASQMNAHPSVFVRFPEWIRGVLPAEPAVNQNLEPLSGPDDPNEIDPVALFTVARRPTHSTWELMFDGVLIEVTVPHGSLDVRRPRDIYQQILLKYLAADGAAGSPLPGLVQVLDLNTSIPPSFAFQERGGTLRVWDFLQYASLRALWDDSDVPILEPVTPIGPPPPPP